MEKLVPRLRFPGFESNWKQYKLSELYELISGQHLNPDDYSVNEKNDTPYFTGPSDFTNDHTKLTKWSKVSGKVAFKNDILFTVKGSGVGSLMYLQLPQVAMGRQLMAIRSRESSTALLFQILSTKRHLYEALAGGNMIPGLSRGDILDTKLWLPTFKEQDKIASFLLLIDNKLLFLKKKKALLEKYKKGMMQKIFNQEVRFKDEEGKNFGEWSEKKLENICDFFRGSALSKSDLNVDGINLCIHYGELFTKYNEVINNVISKTNISGFRSELGDILMPSSDVTPLGLAKASSLQLPDIILGGDVNILRPQKVESRFLSYLLNFSYSKIIEIVSGTTVKHIYNKDIKKLEFKIPEGTIEQANIADFLSAIDDKINLVAQEIEKMEVWKKGLLDEMFV